MSEEIYNNWKNSLAEMYKSHEKLLKYNRLAGIGMAGNIQISISELEENIKVLEEQVKKYESSTQK